MLDVLLKVYPQRFVYRTALLLSYAPVTRTQGKTDSNIWLNYSQRYWRLRTLLNGLTRRGARFKVPIKTNGASELLDCIHRHERILLCSGHFLLNGAMFRFLSDHELSGVRIVSAWFQETETHPVWGSESRIKLIQNNASSLHEIRELFHDYSAFAVNVDSQSYYRGGIPHLIGGRQIYLYPNIVRFAMLTETPIVFFAGTNAASDGIGLSFKIFSKRIPRNEAEVEQCMSELAEFLTDCLRR